MDSEKIQKLEKALQKEIKTRVKAEKLLTIKTAEINAVNNNLSAILSEEI